MIFAAALPAPPLLDDADATHAQAAQYILQHHDWVTLHVNGIRYLEKAPLPYWIAALSLRLFALTHAPLAAYAALAIHLPLALTVLALALLGYAWSRRAFHPFPWAQRAALYTALFTLTSTGVFLFTRVFIPDALLSLLLALTLYHLLLALDPTTNRVSQGYSLGSHTSAQKIRALAPDSSTLLWLFLALAVLTKGLVALVFFFGAAIPFLLLTGEHRNLHRLRPIRGLLLFLAIAAPWHILAGLRNTGAANGHGFFWFYFVNEHYLRFLGQRIPRDYNKLPAALYWLLHLIWLFPWSLFLPTALLIAYRAHRANQAAKDLLPDGSTADRLTLINRPKQPLAPTLATRTVLLLTIYSALVLVFFSLSTNQEYYTFPVYLPLLLLLAATLARATSNPGAPVGVPDGPHLPVGVTRLDSETWVRRMPEDIHNLLTPTFTLLTLLGLAIASALALGLYASRHLPYNPDIGSALAHRGVGNYTLSMSHFFDLTGPSFAALRLPATLAALAFALGPILALLLHRRRNTHAALLTVAATSATFLIAAHIALVRFAPMLSSQDLAATIQTLQSTHQIAPDTQVMLYGDQAFGSSIPFYLDHPVTLVDGRSTSMLFGSTFPDAPPLFLNPTQLLTTWGTGQRKILFVPLEQRDVVDHLLGPNQILLRETSGKALLTDRPLSPPTEP